MLFLALPCTRTHTRTHTHTHTARARVHTHTTHALPCVQVECPANFFRVSSDINADWNKVMMNLQCSIYFNKIENPIAGPGCFAYPDM